MSDAQSDPTYVLLGATSAIGSAVARRLCGRAQRTLLCGRDEGRLAALGEELDAPTQTFDAHDGASIAACFDRGAELTGRVGGALCAVGSIVLKPAHLTKDDVWRETMALNLDAAFFTLREAAKRMQRTGGGSVVFVSSAAARVGMANHEAIAAAKAGVDGMVRAAAATYGPRNIRVNSVAPGLVDTPLAARITGNDKALEVSRGMHPLGRIGAAEDVAGLIDFLLDERNAWITGQTLGVDGGLGVAHSR